MLTKSRMSIVPLLPAALRRVVVLLVAALLVLACESKPAGQTSTASASHPPPIRRAPAPPQEGARGSEPVCDMKVSYDVKIPMRDSVRLSADVYRPKQEGKYPVILSRTPYNNNSKKIVDRVRYYVERCYVYVYVDCRGRHDSDGEWYPLVNEGEDGYDAIEWAAAQPWSTGKVGTLGGSYVAWNQWLAAILEPPHLVTMVALVSPPDPFYNVPYQYGVLMPAQVDWLAFVSGRVNQDSSAVDMAQIWRHLPLMEMAEAAGRRSKVWRDWIEHYRYDEYWKRVSYQHRFADVKVPAFHISGWYDDDQPGTFMNYRGMRTSGGTESARLHQRLLTGPWPHRVNSTSKLGRIDFGPSGIIDLEHEIVRWFDRWLKDVPNGVTEQPRVRLFVMGKNEWRDEEDWPLPDTRWTKYYLHSGGRANSLFGDGNLSTEEPGKEPPDKYSYDPADPVPFIMEPSFAQLGGPDDYRPAERRDDVLVFSSEVLKEDLEVTGPIELSLWAASSAKDTDFTAMLLDVHPNGYSQRLVDGIIRGRFRDSLEKPELMTPRKVYPFKIDMWSTSHVFRRGHRIRVDVSSSLFPKFARNLNTGKIPGRDAEMVIADQTVHHDEKYPSHITLPVIPPRPAASGEPAD